MLTRRQKQVLRYSLEGLTAAEVGIALNIKTQSVQQLQAQARARLGVRSTLEAATLADLSGLLEDDSSRLVKLVFEVEPEDVEAIKQFVAERKAARYKPAEFKLPEHIAHDQSRLRRAEK